MHTQPVIVRLPNPNNNNKKRMAKKVWKLIAPHLTDQDCLNVSLVSRDFNAAISSVNEQKAKRLFAAVRKYQKERFSNVTLSGEECRKAQLYMEHLLQEHPFGVSNKVEFLRMFVLDAKNVREFDIRKDATRMYSMEDGLVAALKRYGTFTNFYGRFQDRRTAMEVAATRAEKKAAAEAPKRMAVLNERLSFPDGSTTTYASFCNEFVRDHIFYYQGEKVHDMSKLEQWLAGKGLEKSGKKLMDAFVGALQYVYSACTLSTAAAVAKESAAEPLPPKDKEEEMEEESVTTIQDDPMESPLKRMRLVIDLVDQEDDPTFMWIIR